MTRNPVDLEFLNQNTSRSSGFQFVEQLPTRKCRAFAKAIEERAREAGVKSGLRTRVSSWFICEDPLFERLPECFDATGMFRLNQQYRIYFEYDHRLFNATWVGATWDDTPFGCSEVHIELDSETILSVSHIVGTEPRLLSSAKSSRQGSQNFEL